MTTPAPGCYVVHPGQPAPTSEKQERICAWLEANGIDPARVPLTEPVIVLTVPQIRGVQPPPDAPWNLQVIVFTEFHLNAGGHREMNLLTRQPVTAQRTVPLTVPYPTTEGSETHGEAHGQAAEATPQVLVRNQGSEEVPDRHEGPRPQRPGEGVGSRKRSAEEAGEGRRHEAVPEPQEDPHEGTRPQEEVAAASPDAPKGDAP